MFLFSAITIPVAIIMLVLSFAIYKGKTGLIHDYHRTNVKAEDKFAYGKAMGKALAVVSVPILISGIIALFGSSDAVILTAVAVMFAGIIIGFICIYKVQKKYNGGMFGDLY